MAGSDGPEETGDDKAGRAVPQSASDDDLDRRRRQLERALAGRRKQERIGQERRKSSIASGYTTALRLSGEFIAGVLGGALIGWLIDRFAGTSPWGMIVFLLLGFCAGVLSILRSAGLVTERSITPSGRKPDSEDNGRL